MSGTLTPGQPNGRIAAVSGRNRIIAAAISQQVPDAPEAPVPDDPQEDAATLSLPETQEKA